MWSRRGCLLVLAVVGCGAAPHQSAEPVALTEPAETGAALDQLATVGPENFSAVTHTLFRGGQPSDAELELLHTAGVRTVIDLRAERMGVRRAERTKARELGMRFVEFPFYGVFGADKVDMDRLLAELERPDGGAVYVHCGDGVDRTSLVVALYRVCMQGWDPDRAWEQEALAYGHKPNVFNREIGLTYDELVIDHYRQTQSAPVLADQPGRQAVGP